MRHSNDWKRRSLNRTYRQRNPIKGKAHYRHMSDEQLLIARDGLLNTWLRAHINITDEEQVWDAAEGYSPSESARTSKAFGVRLKLVANEIERRNLQYAATAYLR